MELVLLPSQEVCIATMLVLQTTKLKCMKVGVASIDLMLLPSFMNIHHGWWNGYH